MQNDINYYTGNIIKKYRESRNYTQEEFAIKCNISRAYYGRIERGEYNVTLKLCKQIADALNIPLYLLFIDLPE